eukprot:5782424-Prymnesium_polylepis.1
MIGTIGDTIVIGILNSEFCQRLRVCTCIRGAERGQVAPLRLVNSRWLLPLPFWLQCLCDLTLAHQLGD